MSNGRDGTIPPKEYAHLVWHWITPSLIDEATGEPFIMEWTKHGMWRVYHGRHHPRKIWDIGWRYLKPAVPEAIVITEGDPVQIKSVLGALDRGYTALFDEVLSTKQLTVMARYALAALADLQEKSSLFPEKTTLQE